MSSVNNSTKKMTYRINKVSNSLVRKSLELAGYSSLNKEKRKRKYNGYKGALELIPAKHRIISSKEKKDVNTVLGRRNKITVYEAKKRLEARQDPTEENVQKLLALSNNCVNTDIVEKILNRTVKTRQKKRKEEKKSEATAFTEEDFKNFEQEYVDE